MKTLSHAFDRGPRPAMADSAAGLLPLLQKGAVACAILAVEPELLRQGLTAPIEAELAQNGVALTPAELASGRPPQEHAADLAGIIPADVLGNIGNLVSGVVPEGVAEAVSGAVSGSMPEGVAEAVSDVVSDAASGNVGGILEKIKSFFTGK